MSYTLTHTRALYGKHANKRFSAAQCKYKHTHTHTHNLGMLPLGRHGANTDLELLPLGRHEAYTVVVPVDYSHIQGK